MNPAKFLREFRFWAPIVVLNALPGFVIACYHLKLWKSGIAIAAMLSAIGLFTILYPAFVLSVTHLADRKHLLSRALRTGAVLKSCMAGAGILLLFGERYVMCLPDTWAGLLSFGALGEVRRWLGIRGKGSAMDGLVGDGFLTPFAVSVSVALLLSFLLLFLAFAALIVLQWQKRREMFRNPDPRRIDGI